MKVLMINTVKFLVNGISTTIMEIFRQLNTKVEFSFVVNEQIHDSFKEEILEKGCNIYILPSRGKKTRIYRKQLSTLLKENHFDIVHIHGNSSTMFLETSLKSMKKSKIIVHAHNIASRYPIINFLLSPLFSNSYNLAIACSNEAGKFLFKKKSFTVIGNSIDCNKYHFSSSKRNELRKKYDLQDKKVILHVGRFNIQKNHIFILDIINSLEEKENYMFVFIGNGDKEVNIKEKTKKFNLEKHVLFLGVKDDINNYYNMADCFILPSLYESFGIVILEAQVNGLKCIVSSNIPSKINFTNNVKFLNLELNDWISEIKNTNISNERADYVTSAINLGYDIHENIKRYLAIYEELVK